MSFINDIQDKLTLGDKIYVAFQLVYLLCVVLILYIQWHILLELKKKENPYNEKNEDNDFTYSSDLESRGRNHH
jgi:hypothetical protein